VDRLPTRACWTISDLEVLKYLRGSEKWKKLRTISRIRSFRQQGEHQSIEDRYHIASITGAKRLLVA
jgi:hypothetical protein